MVDNQIKCPCCGALVKQSLVPAMRHEQVKIMRNSGMRFKEIADRMGSNINTVQALYRHIGKSRRGLE